MFVLIKNFKLRRKIKEKIKKIYSLRKIVASSLFNKSLIATLITSERFGYILLFTNSSIPLIYASGRWTVVNFILTLLPLSTAERRARIYLQHLAYLHRRKVGHPHFSAYKGACK